MVAYDEKLTGRVRKTLGDASSVTKRKELGGIAFMVRGNMCCGIIDDRLMVRVGPEAYEKSLTLSHAAAMDYTGKPMRGFVYVSPNGIKDARQLRA